MPPDPHDAVLDARAELTHDGIYVSTRDVVRATLAFEETHDYYRKLSPLARHPFGLPTVAPSPGDAPVGLRSVSPPPAGAQVDGHHLPHAA